MSSPEPRRAERENEPDDRRRRRALARLLHIRRSLPNEQLRAMVAEHRREVDQQTARFERTLIELERRQQLLGDARASIERLLRLGAKDLDARESDLVQLMQELEEREARTREGEAELAERRRELGAVELKRLVVEQRERALQEREARIEETARASSSEPAPRADEPALEATLAFLPGPSYRVVEIAAVDAEPGSRLSIDGEEYTVLRVGPSPLPGDARRCVYVVLDERSSGGSS